MRYLPFLILFWIFGVVRAVRAATILVGPGEEYSAIQLAIEAAADGDVVQVLPGEYVENIILKEGVDVVGSGAAQTIIRSISESFPVATVEGKDDVTLQGFSVAGGYYGIRCGGVSPTITDCIIWQNSSCGILMEGSSSMIARCLVAQNPGYGVQCLDSSTPTISNCTFSANGYGVFSSGSAPALTNCILWDNWNDLEGISDGNLISHCDIRGGDFAGENGNISSDPRFVAWGSFNDLDHQLYVDFAHLGSEEGTQENPFTKIASVPSVYSYHLGFGSPCLNAGEGNVHMGVYPHKEPSEAPGSDSVVVNVAPGTYYESRLFACHGARVRGDADSPARIVASGKTAFFALGSSSVENFIITGANDGIDCFFSYGSVYNCVILQCGRNGIYCFGGVPLISRCHISYSDGAGVLIEGGGAAVSDCYIGRHASAAISCTGALSATVSNCVLTESPVGLSCAGGAGVEVHNTTVSNNGWKGIVATEGASVMVVNSIVWGNAFGELSQEGGSIEATFSNIGGGFPGDGNINAVPLFEQGPLGSFYLDSDSPCLDTGKGMADQLPVKGKTTLRTSEPDTGTVDMGFHYERFEITKISLDDGRLNLQWNSSPTLDYTVGGASVLGNPVAWQTLGNLTATWTRESYSLEEPTASTGFFRVSQP